MKKNLRSGLIAAFLLLTSHSFLYSQLNVVSTDGYVVHITIQPATIIKTNPAVGCAGGYNYNVAINYSVTFTGSNIPPNLYTLQGNLGCGTNTHFFSIPTTGGTGTVTSQSTQWNPVADCATATPTSLGCNTATIHISGPGIPNQSAIPYPFSFQSPLPVTLLGFNAEVEKQKINISWSTATEINSDYFSIEKSQDGISWEVIKTIKGAGNSSALLYYEYADEYPLAGTSFYRLKQTDIDGKFTYSTTRSVKFNGVENIFVYPVPNSGNKINFRGIQEPKNITLIIRDAAGASVYSSTLNGNSIDLPALKPGLYIITLNNKITGEKTNLRYVKI